MIAYELADGVLRYTTVGDQPFADGLASLRAGLAAAGSAAPGGVWHLLFDVRQSTENRSGDELRGIAREIAAHKARLTGRVAILVSRPLYFGLGRMVGAFLDGYGLAVEVFYDPAAADAWLRGADSV